jgi:D-alanyl-D-alanine carboxypeptidase
MPMDPVGSRASMDEMVKKMGTGKPSAPQSPVRPVPVIEKPKPPTALPASIAPVRPQSAAPMPSNIVREREPIQLKALVQPTQPKISGGTSNKANGNSSGTSTNGFSKVTALLGQPPKTAPDQASFRKSAVAAPRVQAKALFCVDCSSNKVMLADNVSEPLPIASITKLLTAMVVIDGMDLDKVVEVPNDIAEVEPHKVGIRPGDRFTVSDLLHGMLIESGNDCAEVLARSYGRGGRYGFIARMNRRAAELGASRTVIYTPSGLDAKQALGRKEGRTLEAKKWNMATAEDVATIARKAFSYPLIRKIAGMKTYTMRTQNQVSREYRLASNDKLLNKNLPVAGAKTGFTNKAGRCIVALFSDQMKEHVVVVLNSPQHFKAAEKIYRWACKAL